ncbi:MAG: glycoside hydrolase family 36 N-terminal domain-containing protein, partial [Lachnospiraceae bacterium]
MINENDLLFTLTTRNTTYAFRVLPTGHLEHLYYGRKINTAGAKDALSRKQTTPAGNTISYSTDNVAFTLETARLEMSAYGKGDIREPFIELVHADGSFTSDFLYDSYEIKNGRDVLATLPSSYGN